MPYVSNSSSRLLTSSVRIIRANRPVLLKVAHNKGEFISKLESVAIEFGCASILISVIKLWETPTAELLDTHLNGVLPLLPLSREGQSHEVIETGIQRLMPPGEEPQRDLLSLLYGFASLVLISEEDQDWLVRRFEMLYDILRETRAFQEMAKEGMREGREQGIREGMREGMREGIKNMRQVAENLVATRFSDTALTALVRKYLSTIDDAQALQDLIINLAIVQTPEDARQLLVKK